MGIQHPTKTLSFDPDKAAKLLEELLEVYQKHSPTVGELLTATSNLLYSLGSSMTAFYDPTPREKGPSIDELNRLYYSEPGRLDVAMMLQGMTMSTWYADWERLQTKDNSGKGEDNETNAISNL